MTQVALARASGAFGLGTVGTSLAGGACQLLLMSTTALPFLIMLPWRPRVLRPCDMEYVMLHLIFSLPHA